MNLWKNKYNPFQSFKVLRWHDRLQAIERKEYKAPVNIALDIIQGTHENKKCGKFKCNFCMSDFDDHGKTAQIPENILLAIPEFWNRWGVKSTCVAGHNSDFTMYRPQSVLIEFFRRLKEYGIELGAVTNGAYLSRPVMDQLVKTPKWTGFSVNAGSEKSHHEITGTHTFNKIIDNIKYMASIKPDSYTLGYKFLILPENYKEIYKACELAKSIGIRHFQIRPAELPENRSKLIDVELVENQIIEAIKDFEEHGVFEIFGVREKFTPDFKKRQPKACLASPLGSTWKADGDIVICPDRRWSAHKKNMALTNFIDNGFDDVIKAWNDKRHDDMIKAANKDIDNCIRCTSIHWHEIYDNVIMNDTMDLSLI
jgi:hypothetical protein